MLHYQLTKASPMLRLLTAAVGIAFLSLCQVTNVEAAQKPQASATLSPTEKIKPGMTRKTCFPQSSNTKGFEVKENLTKEQKEILTRIKANSLVIEGMKLNWSIQNSILTCLTNSTPINGFYRKPTKPSDLISITSTFTLLPMNKLMTLNSNGTYANRINDIEVKVTFNPATSYSVEVINR
jgi:hypothetical protein